MEADYSVETLISKVEDYITSEQSVALISKAYNFAKEKHEGQFRKSGEPYFSHCFAVACILADMHCGPQTICAGLLHDVMEDCGVDYQTIETEFDKDIATLVEALTKISGLKLTDQKEYEATNHRKIFIAMAKDIRVIIVKLVDRLHNVRTLQYHTIEKQKKIASETLEVYCPIAHRLGLAEIKNEMEDICFRVLQPEKYAEIAHLLEMKKSERQMLVDKMIVSITDLLNQYNFEFRIFGRSKHIYSIYNKMVTKNKRFDEIFDLYAIRIVTQTELNCYEILGYIHATYKPVNGRLKDYIAMPKMNMYQSLHTTVLDQDGNIFEIQIRTEQMDEVAEKGIAAHWAYKEGTKYNNIAEQKEIEDKLGWFHDMVNMMDESELDHPTDFMNQITKDIFEANIYVMTPKGRIIELPNGSTPLDFAYRIHTDVGHSTVGASVNGAFVPLNTVLKTGDIVNIKTSKQSSGPSEDWLKIVKTNTARNKIKAFFIKKENEDRQQDIDKGYKMLCEELKKRGFDESQYIEKAKLSQTCSAFNLNNENELYYAIANKAVNMVQVIEKLTNTKTNFLLDNETLTKFIQSRKDKTHKQMVTSSGVIVKGVDNMMVSLAGCCNPVYGDNIVGYISKGMGIKIHRNDCPNIAGESRMIDVSWSENAPDRIYDTWIRIDATDRNYLISDIVTLLSQYKVSFSSINSEVLPDGINVYVNIKVGVKNAEQLNNLMANLRKINSVVNVSRIVK